MVLIFILLGVLFHFFIFILFIYFFTFCAFLGILGGVPGFLGVFRVFWGRCSGFSEGVFRVFWGVFRVLGGVPGFWGVPGRSGVPVFLEVLHAFTLSWTIFHEKGIPFVYLPWVPLSHTLFATLHPF